MNAKLHPDSFLAALEPLLSDGNEFAAAATLRVVTAADPQAEVVRIFEDYAAAAERMKAILLPLAEAWGAQLAASPLFR